MILLDLLNLGRGVETSYGVQTSFARPTLLVARSELQIVIADYAAIALTGPAVPTDTEDLARTNRAMRMCLRQFYYPEVLSGEFSVHQWSFMRPTLTLVTEPGVQDYLLPNSVGGIEGDGTFAASETYGRVINRGEMFMRNQRQSATQTGVPRYMALVQLHPDGAAGTRQQLQLWPKPGSEYQITIRYLFLPDDVSATAVYPVGNAIHSETLLQSARAAADHLFNDNVGVEHELFLRRLRTSIEFDRRNSVPPILGRLSEAGDDELRVTGVPRVTFNDTVIQE